MNARLPIATLLGLLLALHCFAADYSGRIRNVEQRLFDLHRELQQLATDKERTLDELRRGLFCSECSRSKSEIERTGISFQKHLQDVKGHPVAKAELLARKAAEFDRKMMALQQEIAGLEREKIELAESSRQETERVRQEALAERNRRQQEAAQAAELRAQQERQRIVDQAEAKVQNLNAMRDGLNKSLQQLGQALPPKDSTAPTRGDEEKSRPVYPPASADLPERGEPRPDALPSGRLEYPANGTIEERVAYWDKWIPAVQERMRLMNEANQFERQAEMYESGAQDIRRYAEEGRHNASLSQVGALGTAADGAFQIYAELEPPGLRDAYKAAMGSAKMLGESIHREPRSPFELAKTGVNAMEIPVHLEKAEAAPSPPKWDTQWSSKALSGASAYLSYKDGEYAAALSSGASVFGLDRLEAGASVVDGGRKIYKGAQGLYEGQQLKQRIDSYSARMQDGLLDRSAWARQQEAERRRRVEELDRLLPPARP